jgi:hypothetical protein
MHRIELAKAGSLDDYKLSLSLGTATSNALDSMESSDKEFFKNYGSN